MWKTTAILLAGLSLSSLSAFGQYRATTTATVFCKKIISLEVDRYATILRAIGCYTTPNPDRRDTAKDFTIKTSPWDAIIALDLYWDYTTKAETQIAAMTWQAQINDLASKAMILNTPVTITTTTSALDLRHPTFSRDGKHSWVRESGTTVDGLKTAISAIHLKSR